nr:MAG TPA: hypothetical protein [Bacteriophage sp.]
MRCWLCVSRFDGLIILKLILIVNSKTNIFYKIYYLNY